MKDDIKLLETLRCPGCQGRLEPKRTEGSAAELYCSKCSEGFPVIGGIPRLLLSPLREALLENGAASGTDERQVQTALSFGFEWSRFPEMYKEWNQSFLNYMQPHGPEFFRGRKLLDPGPGNGRFACYAAKYAAAAGAVALRPPLEVALRKRLTAT